MPLEAFVNPAAPSAIRGSVTGAAARRAGVTLIRTRLLAIVCSVLCGACTATVWLPPGVHLEFTPDSSEYEAIAQNLASHHGYVSQNGNIAANRSPVYPVLLASMFDADVAIWRGRIIWLHRCLAFAIGASLVWLANDLFGGTGLVCGILASILVMADDESAYAGSELLTELPAAAFLMLSLLVARWVVRGGPRRELLMAAIQIALFMTRSAMVFCGIGYGLYLIYQTLAGNARHGVVRILLFAIPCILAILAWSAFVWARTGQFVLLTTTGTSNLAAGLSPDVVAATQGWPVPRTDTELEEFWTMAPPVSSGQTVSALSHALNHPVQTLKVTVAKFKVAFNRLPIGAFFLGVCGFAIQFVVHLVRRRDEPSPLQPPFSLRKALGRAAYTIAFCSCILAVCGYSHPLARAGVVVAAMLIVVCRVSPAGQRYAERTDGHAIPPILCIVCLGFLFMTLASFGLPRFTRPFLPALYLSATLCIPLAARLLNPARRVADCTIH